MGSVMRVPHPIPYQGSKRGLAARILGTLPRASGRLIEPFAGSAAVTLAAAARRAFSHYVIADALEPLAGIWRLIISAPDVLASRYADLWMMQLNDPRATYTRIRTEFNSVGEPALLLYLLARCVKAAIRFNSQGEFNQSPDNRRLGMRPEVMRREIMGAHALLRGCAEAHAADFRAVAADATTEDVVYMDPPYEGVTGLRDRRYYIAPSFSREELICELDCLNTRGVPFVLSYDGACGDRKYGGELPAELELLKLSVPAGRSAQSTLMGRAEITVESLYVSPTARDALFRCGPVLRPPVQMPLP